MTRVRKAVLEAISVNGGVNRIACVLSKPGDGLGVIPDSVLLRFKTHRIVLAYASNLNGIWMI